MPKGAKSVLKLPAADRRMMVELVREWTEQHKTDAEMFAMLKDHGITDPREVTTLKRLLLEGEKQEIKSKEPIEVFIDYRRDMLAVVKATDDFVDRMTGEDTHQGSIPSALRVKADVIDKILKRGQDLGVLARKSATPTLLGGIILADLSDGQLLTKVDEMNRRLDALQILVAAPMLGEGGFQYTKRPEDLLAKDSEVEVVEGEVVPERGRPRREAKERVRERPKSRPTNSAGKMKITTSDGRSRPKRRRPV